MATELSGVGGRAARAGRRAALRGFAVARAARAAAVATLLTTALAPIAPVADPNGARLLAQTISASAVAAHADNRLFGDMAGGGFVVESPVGSQSLALRMGAAGVGASRDGRTGTCSGLIPPGQQCGPEPVRATASLWWGLLGVSGQLYARSGLDVRLAADALAGNATSRIRGRTSGRELRGSEIVLGAAVDATLRWFPGKGRWGVGIGAGYSAFAVPGEGDCVDCYVAFEKGVGVATGSVGVEYRRR